MAYVGSVGDDDDGRAKEEERGRMHMREDILPPQSTFLYSNLKSLDVWNRDVLLRSQEEADKAGLGPYRASNISSMLGFCGSVLCCGVCSAKRALNF